MWLPNFQQALQVAFDPPPKRLCRFLSLLVECTQGLPQRFSARCRSEPQDMLDRPVIGTFALRGR